MVTREIYWNVHFPGIAVFMIALGLLPVGYIAFRLRERWRMWRAIGIEEKFPPRDEWGWRARRVLAHTIGQARVRRRAYAGAFHLMILWSFILLFIGTVIVAIQQDFVEPVLSLYFFQGWFYRIFSVVLELAGIAGIAGCTMALTRRYFIQPSYLGGRVNWVATVWLLLAILVSGFIVEGARIKATTGGIVAEINGVEAVEIDSTEEHVWSFLGAGLADIIPADAARSIHWLFWWGHLGISIGFLCTFGERTMGHVFTTSLAVFLARDIPSGATPRPTPDLENAESFGVLAIDQFSQTHLRDADMCVECGRCQDSCPAWLTGKPLSPKQIVNKIRDAWEPLALAKLRGESPPAADGAPSLVGDIITHDELWSCTTCGACEQACPVMIEQVEKIVEMRRGLVLMEGAFPEEVQVAFSNLEQTGNPWGKPADERAAWADGLDIPVPIWGEEGSESAEYIFWVGCAGSYDASSQVVSRAFARLLHHASVKFAILGSAETCTGDPALRIGNEYLYQTLAEQNIDTLLETGVKKIVTACPHCFQTLGKDYPLLGGVKGKAIDWKVIHHSELLEELIASGRLRTDAGATVAAGGRKGVFHDSCYLARHNRIEDEPRAVAAEAMGQPADEPARNRQTGLCCGAGGGRMWMEETLGHTHVNAERAKELLAGGADTVIVSCPFCKTMLNDGVKEVAGDDSGIRVRDIAELLDEALASSARAMPSG
jgi:Fe-S oxidoreductase